MGLHEDCIVDCMAYHMLTSRESCNIACKCIVLPHHIGPAPYTWWTRADLAPAEEANPMERNENAAKIRDSHYCATE